MPADSLLLNLLLFVVAQGTAWWNLHTGRFLFGVVTTVVLWLLVDWWLLSRYVFGGEGAWLRGPLAALQIVAAAAIVAQLFAQWRRRWSATAKRRAAIFGDALKAYLCDDHHTARSLFRRLVRSDPWDVPAWLALGDVHQQLGERRWARWCYFRAKGVDTRKGYDDLLRQRRAGLRRGGQSVTVSVGAIDSPGAI